MGILELIVLIAASPIIAVLVYGAWEFSAES